MTSINLENSVISTGGRELDIATLPEKSILALIRRGATHFFGSEVASKVKAAKDKAEAEGDKVPLTEEQVAELKASFIAEGFTKLIEGTIGDRAVGQSIDPVEALVESLARAEVKDVLRANGIKVPKKDEAVVFGDGSTVSLDELVARRITAHGERLEKEAKKTIAAKEKAKAALKVQAETMTADALGL